MNSNANVPITCEPPSESVPSAARKVWKGTRPGARKKLEVRDVEQRFWNVAEVAVYLGRTPQSVYHLVHRAEIPHFKLGRSTMFDRGEITAWLESKRVAVQ